MSGSQTQLPTLGVEVLKPPEEANQRPQAKKTHLTAPTRFYKKFALDCPGQQAAVDLSLLIWLLQTVFPGIQRAVPISTPLTTTRTAQCKFRSYRKT